MPSSSMPCTATSTPLQCLNHVTGKGKAKLQGPLANLTIPDSPEDPQVIKHVKKKKRKNDDMDEQPNDDSDDIPLQALFKRKGKNDDMDNQPNDDSDDIPLQALFERKAASSSKNRGKKRKACVNKDVMVDPVPKISLHSMPGLKTRSSPAQFARLISILKPKQRDYVYNMGFGQLLTFKCDGIPSKIGYFVVDNFDPQEMEIKAATSSVKVDSVSINKLLGIPMGSKSFLKSKRSKRRDPAVNEWRKRYPNKDVSPTELVDQVMSSPDEDSFNFRMDFLMCFICVMVDCSSQGRVKQKIAKKVYSDIDWSDINFCEYILQVLKDCKNGWKPSSNFNGPLTILTLLYVDSFVCEGMDIDEDKNAISFWNMENLQVRQKMEARNGGFGRGEKKELSHVVDDGTSVLVKSGLFVSLSEMLSEASKNIDCLLSAIVSADTSIRNLIEEFPGAPEVILLQKKYDTIFEDKSSTSAGFLKKTKKNQVGDDLQSDNSSSEDASDDENKEELHDSGDDANHGEDHQSDYDTDSGNEGNVPHDEETNESGDEDTSEQEDNGSDGEESESQQSTKSATEDSQSEEQSKSQLWVHFGYITKIPFKALSLKNMWTILSHSFGFQGFSISKNPISNIPKLPSKLPGRILTRIPTGMPTRTTEKNRRRRRQAETATPPQSLGLRPAEMKALLRLGLRPAEIRAKSGRDEGVAEIRAESGRDEGVAEIRAKSGRDEGVAEIRAKSGTVSAKDEM
ncbi:hypothetical protein SSX86_008426 [Deinandra increscens subsp. villosa]|uniref:Uncharacterized protein n=1 Tax=Deinandra increscens subsp. villosa TaxID=3103831 RepID=A0AAP0DB90_9ASTR